MLLFMWQLQYCYILSCREYQREWQNNGVSVVLWTVNDPAEKDYFGRVLKCPIMTDCVGSSSQQSAP